MMGPDVERILAGINSVKDATIECIKSLSNVSSYRINIIDSREKEVKRNSSDFITPIKESITGIESDCNNMNSLNDGLFTSSNSFNNGYGSPWTELNKLNDAINIADDYASTHSELEWLSEKITLLELLNMILSLSIDAKWALITYHDYIQRGYDYKYNSNTPSVTFTSGINKKSTGNVNQQIEENVHIPQQSIDPF